MERRGGERVVGKGMERTCVLRVKRVVGTEGLFVSLPSRSKMIVVVVVVVLGTKKRERENKRE